MTEESYSDGEPIVETTHGRLRGCLMHGIYGDAYYNFESVPYAAPPLGPNRFKSAQPLEAWTGIRDCTKPGPVCLQSHWQGLQGSEDCLYLSIYAKRLRSARPLPVMVYVHGGRFKAGDYTRRLWAPDYLMQESHVVIMVGHRLGIFGFLAFADDRTLNVPGNAGLKDIICALHWIKANALSFNGDPDNITLAGHSSGSISVEWLLASPRTEGLFQRAIMQGNIHMAEPLQNLAYRMAVEQGYRGAQESRAIYEYFKDLPGEQMLLFNGYTELEKATVAGLTFLPTVEPAWSEDAVVTEELMLAQRSSWSNHIPLLLGTTSNEALPLFYVQYTTEPKLYERMRAEPQMLLPRDLALHCPPQLQGEFTQQLAALHFRQGLPQITRYQEVLDVFSYNFSYHCVHRLIESRRRYATQPTYLQRFAFESTKFSFHRNRAVGDAPVAGVGHADELLFLFFMPGFSVPVDKQGDEYKTLRRMVSMWHAFIATGDPNSKEIEPAVWTPVASDGPYKCLNVDKEVTLIEMPERKICLVMDGWYEKAGLPLY